MKLLLLLVAGLAEYSHQVSAYGDIAYAIASESSQQMVLGKEADRGFGMNEPFIPNPQHLLPEKKPFRIDEETNYYQRFVNGSENGLYRRSSCPGINSLANRGYIDRSGRNVTYSELAHTVRKVWNFGDDNVGASRNACTERSLVSADLVQSMLVLAPTFALHGWPETIDLDMFNVGPLAREKCADLKDLTCRTIKYNMPSTVRLLRRGTTVRLARMSTSI